MYGESNALRPEVRGKERKKLERGRQRRETDVLNSFQKYLKVGGTANYILG